MFGFGKKNEKSADKPIGTYSLKHILGLEIPQTACQILLYEDKMIVRSGAKEYELKIEKLGSVEFELNVDVERYLKSNMARGIIGAAMFGVTGAVVGAAPSSKEKRLVTCCATLSYIASNGEVSYLVFEDSSPNTKEAARFVDKIRPLINSKGIKQRIEL